MLDSFHGFWIFRVVWEIKSLHDPLKVGDDLTGIDDNVRKRGLEEKCFHMLIEGRKRCKVEITLSDRLFQMVRPATGKAWPPAVDNFMDGACRRLLRAERRQRRPRRSVTADSGIVAQLHERTCT